jgi:hypothetical protein
MKDTKTVKVTLINFILFAVIIYAISLIILTTIVYYFWNFLVVPNFEVISLSYKQSAVIAFGISLMNIKNIIKAKQSK